MAVKATVENAVEKAWVVVHGGVSRFYRGEIVTLAHLKGGVDREVDIDRLLRLGAIAPVDSTEANKVIEEAGTDAESASGTKVGTMPPMPPVDVTNRTPIPTA
jgi:hypothetical protein